MPDEARAVDVVRDLVLGRLGDRARRTAAEFRARFAQTSSALRAKSVEDTAFYRYVPLLSADEVGGDPGARRCRPEEFHAYCARVQRDWPATGTVLSTHDTKRSADVRARIAVLTECPDRWRGRAGRDRRRRWHVGPAGRRAGPADLAWAGLADGVRAGDPATAPRRSGWSPRC